MDEGCEEIRISNELVRAAEVAVRDVLKVKKNEQVLIITNPDQDVSGISNALFQAVQKFEGDPSMIVQPVKGQLEFASDDAMAAIRTDPDVILSISKEKLGKDEEAIRSPIVVGDNSYDHYFHYLLREKKCRSFWSPSVTLDIFERCVDIDYTRLQDDCARVKGLLDRGTSVRITAPSGTNIEIGIQERITKSDDGDFTEPGKGGNIPAGEAFISPQLGTSNGTIAFDGSIASDSGIIIIESPIICRVKDGFVRGIEGGAEAKGLEDTITRAEERTLEWVKEGKLPRDQEKHYLMNCRNLGELGIGLNRKAKIIGNMLEDEKVYSTCHIAMGANYDDDAKALIHLDGLIRSPTIVVRIDDGDRTIMKDGELLI
ncbi:MAG: peptidase M17 [Thermoplasmata archaeon]|nr:peptidase M17 [Thermoplasmata archaeon]